MKIREKIKQKSDDIRRNWCTTGKAEAQRLQNEGVAAIKQGRTKPPAEEEDKWKKYMENFHDTPEQLQRLLGDDDEFMENEWAEAALAYIVANGICTEFSFANTLRNMDDVMLFGLDEGITDDDMVPAQIVEKSNKISTSEVIFDERKDI